MAVVPICIVGDPVLHTPTEPVPVGPDGSLPADLPELIQNMFDTMDAANGVGLAANQIGVAKRLFVYDCAPTRGHTTRRRGVVINPVLETSEVPETMPDPDDDEEGCLSVPEIYAEVERPAACRVRWQDLEGKVHEEQMEGLMATCIQHEMDHLDGILFIDHLSRLKRQMALRKLEKLRKAA